MLRYASPSLGKSIGVALSQYLETGDAKYGDIIKEAQNVVNAGVENFATVGEKAASVLATTSEGE